MNLKENAQEAVRLGIGKRVQELGFTQVEPTMFRKEDGDLKLRVDCLCAIDGTFNDDFGATSKSLEALIAGARVDESQYNIHCHDKRHLRTSGLDYWRRQRDSDFAKFHWRMRKFGPIYWFYPWRERFERHHPYGATPFITAYRWDASVDLSRCAAQSLQIWERYVQSYCSRIQDPKWYAYYYSMMNGQLLAAIAYAWAGEMEKARGILQRELNDGRQDEEDVRVLVSNSSINIDEIEIEEEVAERLMLTAR